MRGENPPSAHQEAGARMARHEGSMAKQHARAIVLDRQGGIDPCSSCDARPFSVCNAIGDADIARLAAIAVITEAPAGRTFIDEGEPANAFFNITAGHAKLFKLLPDGRRQITGFVSV